MTALLNSIRNHLIILLILLPYFFALPVNASLSRKGSFFIKSLAESRDFVSNYAKNNPTTEAYLLDLLVNNKLHSIEAAKLKDSGIYFYYEAQVNVKLVADQEKPNFDKALQSIDKAIQKDPIALNYFYKSFLLSLIDNKAEADKVYIEGINKPYNCNYPVRGSEAFVKMIMATGENRDFNVYWYLSDIVQLSIHRVFYELFVQKIKQDLEDGYFSTTSSKQVITPDMKKNIICGMTSFSNTNYNAFFITQENLIRGANDLLKILPKDAISKTCTLRYDPEALKEPADFRILITTIESTDDLTHMLDSIIWQNYYSISKRIQGRQK